MNPVWGHIMFGLSTTQSKPKRGIPNNGRKGVTNGNARLTEEQVLSIYHDTRSMRTIAKDHGIGVAHVHSIKRRSRWAHLTIDE